MANLPFNAHTAAHGTHGTYRLDGYEEAGYEEPCLEIDELTVAVQDISYEFGNVDHIHKIGGVWDSEEIKFHMLSGLLPEVTYVHSTPNSCACCPGKCTCSGCLHGLWVLAHALSALSAARALGGCTCSERLRVR